jgi:hypothetical protein
LGNRSVTNDIKDVLRRIEHYHQGSIAGFRIMYPDSQCMWDGKNAYFFPSSETEEDSASPQTLEPLIPTLYHFAFLFASLTGNALSSSPLMTKTELQSALTALGHLFVAYQVTPRVRHLLVPGNILSISSKSSAERSTEVPVSFAIY